MVASDQPESQFLHALCHPLAVGFGHLKLLAAQISEKSEFEDIRDRVDKIIDAYEIANQMISERKHVMKDECSS